MHTQARGTSESSCEDLEPSPEADRYTLEQAWLTRQKLLQHRTSVERLRDGAVLSFSVFAFVCFSSWHSKKSLSKQLNMSSKNRGFSEHKQGSLFKNGWETTENKQITTAFDNQKLK